MNVPGYTVDDLRKLPLRAITAFAARCARRVEHLTFLTDDHPNDERCRAAIRDAIGVAEDFARGSSTASSASIIRQVEAIRTTASGEFIREQAITAAVHAARAACLGLDAIGIQSEARRPHLLSSETEADVFARLVGLTADLTALTALTSAVDAADAIGYSNEFLIAVARDYDALLGLNLGRYPQAGDAVDSSQHGPLGLL
jgi:hypothetical protein